MLKKVFVLIQLFKIKFAFHRTLDIVIKTNCQKNNQPLSTQISFYLWDKLLYVYNWNVPQTWIETKSWTCFKSTNFKNSNFVIYIIASNQFPLMVNNINQSLVANGTLKKTWFTNLWFWMTKITMKITHWANDDIYYTIYTHFLEQRCNKVSNGQHLGHMIFLL